MFTFLTRHFPREELINIKIPTLLTRPIHKKKSTRRPVRIEIQKGTVSPVACIKRALILHSCAPP